MIFSVQPGKFAVIGHPIGHTMSPFIHNRLFSLNGLKPEYSVIDVKNIEENLNELKSLDGFNITIPHKQGIIPFLDKIDKKAERFGSVNTVSVENGKLTGYTTDGKGCLEALRRKGAGLDKVLILGTGGAARAIAFQLELEGAKITVAGRNREKAAELSCKLNGGGGFLSLEELSKNDESFDLLINATSVGMHPNINFSPVSADAVKRCGSVFDAVYNPRKTELIKLALSLNKKVIYGMDMLVLQAAEAHRLWYGGEFDHAEIDRLCTDADEEMKRIFEVIP